MAEEIKCPKCGTPAVRGWKADGNDELFEGGFIEVGEWDDKSYAIEGDLALYHCEDAKCRCEFGVM